MKFTLFCYNKSMKTQIELTDIAEAKKYLSKKDKKMAKFLKVAPKFNLKPNSLVSVYQALIESIIAQQLNGKAASCIFKRLCDLYSSKSIIRPIDILRTEDEDLRNIGISRPKIASIRDLTEFEIEGKLPNINKLHKMTNEEIIENLVKIRGIGNWTVEMLLIFCLGRVDVISGKDLGLRKGLAVIEGIYPRLPTSEEMLEKAEKCWKPYRSIASWYLWRAAEQGRITTYKVRCPKAAP